MNLNSIRKFLFTFFISICLFQNAFSETKDQQVKVALRAVGNEFLLQMKDSTSRVLPISLEEGRYVIKFERKFEFEPGLLSYSVIKTFENKNIKDSYVVEIEECETQKLVHSFIADLKESNNELACRGRVLPNECYAFYFTLIKPVNVEITKTEETKAGYWFGAIILLIGLLVFFLIRKKINSQLTNKEILKVGKYYFDKKEMTLTLNKQFIELSSKESDLLYLLYSNENKTLKRERILQDIWGDEGSYIGRTLDVFISKLRKKLEADSKIKIVNVRGVGYKMVIS